MGVTGLWQVVQPCARPIKLETLNRKRLAVDASIWIYQFLKAVRDKEGNALRNSHVVGFFRRICKLLFFGIKPVFVFDGGAPALKRQTITARKQRREGRREDAARTAGRLLAVQMQRRAEEEDRRRKEERNHPAAQEEEEVPDDLVYTEELLMTEKERKQNRTFKKKDAYHLPDLDVSLSEMGAPNDPRIMSQEELEEYARQFHTGEDINFYDFSKIDFNSSFFQSLPAADRYNILNAARLRSRLRMGYSKEQLDEMFPDRMAFSRFQIDRVKERNELTQRLMNLNGMMGDMFINGTQRVAGERGKEYVLVKNDGVEGGWALGVVSNKNEGERNQPIDVDELGVQPKAEDEEWEDEDDFEDIPMEGVNRLPKPTPTLPRVIQPLGSVEARTALQQAISQSQRNEQKSGATDLELVEDDPEALFLPGEVPVVSQENDEDDGLFEDVLPATTTAEHVDDDEELQRAIAMSLENENGNDSAEAKEAEQPDAQDQGHRAIDFVNQKSASAGRAFAQISNNRAQASVTNSDFSNAFSNTTARRLSPTPAQKRQQKAKPKAKGPQIHGFSGPLPFESLDLGGSFLRKKKKVEPEGGFNKDESKKEEPALPPWFAGTDVRDGVAAQTAMDVRQMAVDENKDTPKANDYGEPLLRKQDTTEIIEVDGTQPSKDTDEEVMDIHSSSDESDDIEMGEFKPAEKARKPIVIDSPPRMEDVAEDVRANPPSSMQSVEPPVPNPESETAVQRTAEKPAGGTTDLAELTETTNQNEAAQEDEYEFEWSDSDIGGQDEVPVPSNKAPPKPPSPASSPEPEFENVSMPEKSPAKVPSLPSSPAAAEASEILPANELPDPPEDGEFSDSEDEELMRQLATEAEEHTRFAASLNMAASKQSVEEYERELRQLRTQQKKDRRDADEVTHIMITECQQLLQLFGLPYITAPMEAEAQCAELVSLGLVDGIVTDDSDIFLFGGTRVYKNMFNQAKFVECYIASDLEKEYSLTREKIIQMAHLLGSDYTEGLPGVGPVSALEILSEFPDLSAFSEWWTDVQSGTNQPPPSELKQSSFRKKFRKNATKLFLPPSFPDPRVDEAYLQPEVDRDNMPFQWGVPDLDALRAFLMQTIGWTRERTDEVLVPVVRDMNRRETEGTQSNITHFFTGSAGTGAGRMRGLAGDHGPAARSTSGNANADGSRPADTDGDAAAEAFAPRRRNLGGSKRMETALGKLHQQAQAAQRVESSRKRRTTQDADEEEDASERSADRQNEAKESSPHPRKAVRRTNRRRK